MFITHHREKLENAIAYFLGNTRHCHTIKLFKLLNFLDFEHYRQTGWSVTGLSYQAFPNGPVPRELYDEIRAGGRGNLTVTELRDGNGRVVLREFDSKNDFDSSYFTPRELKIMEELARRFRDSNAEAVIEQSHSPQHPWARVYADGSGDRHAIPYELALEAEPIMKDQPSVDAYDIAMLDEEFGGIGIR